MPTTDTGSRIRLLSGASLLVWVEWALLLAGLALFTITESYRSYVLVGLCLVGASFIIRGLRTQHWFSHTGLELPGAVFLLSAALSTWIAYDQKLAFLQWVRFVGTAVLFCAVVDSHEDVKRLLAFGFLVGAAILAFSWPFQPGLKTGLSNLELPIPASLHLPTTPIFFIHANIAAGTLAASLPFGLALGLTEWRRRRFILMVICGLLSLVILACLVLTGSRGAWLALLGTGMLALFAIVQRRWFKSPRQKIWFWLAIAALALILLAGLVTSGWSVRLAGSILGPAGSVQSRLDVWKQSLSLIRDYVFTGSGLMTFPMVYANYALLINVPFLAHAHNSYLEVWIEQGFLGEAALLAAIVVVIRWAWRALDERDPSLIQMAALAALAVAMLHGLVDVVFYLNRTLPVLGLVLGLAWQPQGNKDPGQVVAVKGAARTRDRFFQNSWALWGLGSLAVLIVVGIYQLRKPLLSAWFTNLGALAQTQQELRVYQPSLFEKFSLDQVRQTVDLRLAEREFHQALSFETSNVAAVQRLAQISLSRGQYEEASNWMQIAWEAGYRDDITRLLYGDTLVAYGEVEPAAQVVRGLGRAEDRLMEQAWYRYWKNEDYMRAIWAWKTVLILDPINANAARNVAMAAKRLK